MNSWHDNEYKEFAKFADAIAARVGPEEQTRETHMEDKEEKREE